MSEFDEQRKRSEEARRAEAAKRAADRAVERASGAIAPWSARGEVPGVSALVTAAAVTVGGIGGFAIGLVFSPLGGVLLGGAAAIGAAVLVRRFGRRPPAANPRLRAAYDAAIAALDAADLEPERRAELVTALDAAARAVDALPRDTPPETREQRVREFEAQGARLAETARALGSPADTAGAALGDAIGALEDEARASAELDEALLRAGATARAPVAED